MIFFSQAPEPSHSNDFNVPLNLSNKEQIIWSPARFLEQESSANQIQNINSNRQISQLQMKSYSLPESSLIKKESLENELKDEQQKIFSVS